MIEHFYSENHNGNHQDINVKITDFCDPSDQEKRENFWMNKLRTLYPEGLNNSELILLKFVWEHLSLGVSII